jgi:hypothetical protein
LEQRESVGEQAFELAVPRCIDHILEARGVNEQVLPVREHLVMDQGMRIPEVLSQVTNGSTNLRAARLDTAA